MKTHPSHILSLCFLLFLAFALPRLSHAADTDTSKPVIYDESADAQKQLTAALEQGKKEN